MKLAKKILVAVLALALLASAFLFSSTAEDAFHAPGMSDVDDILEYYALDDYLADNYNNGTWTTDLVETDADHSQSNINKYGYQLIDVSAAKDPKNSENGVLGVKLPYNKKSGYRMAAAKKTDGLTDKLLLTFKIYFDESATDNLFYELKVGMVNDNGKASSSEYTVLQFNFSKNNGDPGFYYSTWNPNTMSFGSELTAYPNVAPETGKWYDVVITVNAADDVYSFNVKDLETGADVVASGDLSLAGAKSVWGFYCYGKFLNTKSADKDATRKSAAQFYLDDMEIYEGSYIRYPSLKAEVTRTHLQDLDALYNAATDYESKREIVEVIDYLYNEAEGFTVGDAMPNAQKYINETYAKAFSDAVANVNTTASYYDRLAYLDTIAYFDERIPSAAELKGAAGITPELEALVVAGRAAYAAEIEAINTIKTQSDAFISLMADFDNTNKSYVYVTDYIAEAGADKYAKRDASYEGIAAAEEIFAALKYKAERMAADVEVFTTAVDKMAAAQTFGPLFSAYTEAYESYTRYGVGIINPDLDNSTKAGLPEKIEYYESKVESVLATAFICDEFNRIIKEATISSYYTTLVGELAEAAEVRAQFGEYEMDYPGITESVAVYEAFLAAVNETKTAVEAYIAAVNAIATKTTFADKKAAVVAATALKADGDILGAEGVVEANIALTAAEAEINFLEGNSTTLISLVEQLKAAETLAERRALIHLANAAAENAEDTYTGVSAAKADLATAIAAFEADVAAANTVLENAIKSAQAIVSSVNGSAIFVEGN